MSAPEVTRSAILMGPQVHAVFLSLHIGAGLIGIVSGYVALAAPKGLGWHRAAGKLFFAAMLAMSGVALVMAVINGQTTNITAALLTFYLVTTSFAAVRRPENTIGLYETLACLLALGVGLTDVTVGYLARDNPHGIDGVPYQAAYVFGGVSLLAALLDMRVIRRGGSAGVSRISRHLWRMTLALFIATGSFFLGQMRVIPHALRGPHIWVLALAPLAALIFWMIRVRFRNRLSPGAARLAA